MMPTSALPSNAFPKSVERTVFVRFRPSSTDIRRHHLEELFSQVGPIKKTSVVAKENASSYGFVKYITEQDAQTAARTLNHKTIKVEGKSIQVIVEAASVERPTRTTPHQRSKLNNDRGSQQQHTAGRPADNEATAPQPTTSSVPPSKNQTRLILRNLAFSTKESHIRQALEERFGPLVEVHLPAVPKVIVDTAGANQRNKKPLQPSHRGFGFVQFADPRHAADCVKSGRLTIGARDVEVSYTLNKTMYEQEKSKKPADAKKKENKKQDPKASRSRKVEDKKIEADLPARTDIEVSGDDPGMEPEGVDDGSNSESFSDSDSSDDIDSDTDDDDEDEGGVDKKGDAQALAAAKPDTAIHERRVVFLRNMPFDATRQDVFELIRKFGRIEAIHLVKNKAGLFQGSCFVHFAKREAAEKLVDTYNQDAKFTPQKQVAGANTEGLQLNGRTVLVDLAVDKETAAAVASDRSSDVNGHTKDRRHLYLKGEGRVDDPDEWQRLPPSDQQKRQRAWSDKLTKLKSPLFFINPTRLSIRNLAKSVDEKMFKQMCVTATQRGLEKNRVTIQDLVLHWKAKGDLSQRDILGKMQESQSKGLDLIPKFEESNVKRYIPSVFIDRDFTTRKAGVVAPSRGFGFVEFTHHVHALACLRELNNNPSYMKFVAGGGSAVPRKKGRDKGAAEALQPPRLIVEFAVENIAKAKQQALHRAQHELNQKKQREEKSDKLPAAAKIEPKKSRGAAQREKKRKERDDPQHGTSTVTGGPPAKSGKAERTMHPGQPTSEGTQPIKPTKKRKIDPAEAKFDELVENYKRTFEVMEQKTDTSGSSVRKPSEVSKRWFD